MDNPIPPRRTFKDADGNEWCLKLDNLIADELKTEGLLDIDEFEREPDVTLGKLIDGSREWLPKILCVILNEQREKKQIERIRFDGTALDNASKQLQEAIIDYFPFTKRPAFKAALDKTQKVQELAIAKATKMMESSEVGNAITKAIETEMAKVMNRIGD